MINPHQTISEILESTLPNERTKNVIMRRFGLLDGERQTLEEIGEKYGITRERVRQIESVGLKSLSDQKILERLKPTFDFVHSHLSEHGDLRREESLFNDLVYVCYPVALANNRTTDQKNQKNDMQDDLSRCQASLSLILVLGDPFSREKESNHFHPFWAINKKSITVAKKVVDYFTKHFNKLSTTLEFKDLHNQLRELDGNITEKALMSYLDASKAISANKFGHYGLSHWPEVSPKGVRDKAYLVLRQHGQPLHFGEITEMINKSSLDHKKAQVETVHNELIKDSRFVLVGRGIYALNEWGYEPGTVADVIANLLEKHGSLTKEEILQKVLEKRFIKENTILINLQNRKVFIRDEEGKYTLK